MSFPAIGLSFLNLIPLLSRFIKSTSTIGHIVLGGNLHGEFLAVKVYLGLMYKRDKDLNSVKWTS